MKVSKASAATPFKNSPVCKGSSYPETGDVIDGAVIRVTGRYPETGFLVNEVSKELVYVLSGKGKLISKTGSTSFDKGDVVYIDSNEPFAWDGDFEGFFATTPRFDPAQHKEVA